MICLKCKKIVDVSDALVHPHNHSLLFCPVCKRLLLDFGREFVRLSSSVMLEEYDRTGNKQRGSERLIAFVTNPEVDLRILECADAIKIKPDNAEARVTMIKLHMVKRDFDSALKEIVDLEEITGQNITSLALLADVFAEAANYKEAINYCLKILQLDQGNHDARYNLGIALACLGNYSAAANQFIKILKLNPKHVEAKTAFSRVKAYLVKKESES